MALFGSSRAFIGLDIGTSTLKLVELIDRHHRIEVTTYAQANIPNLLVNPPGNVDDAIRVVANAVSRMMDKASVSTDVVVAALPSSIVFSSVLQLPALPAPEMEKAVHFAARDVVPTNIDDMVLSWSRLGEPPHMDAEKPPVDKTATLVVPPPPGPAPAQPVFVTAAPKTIVERYAQLMDVLNLRLDALEVETFPLVRSLLTPPGNSAMIVDWGDQTTTFHVVDRGTARVSHTIDYGGRDITTALTGALSLPAAKAEASKIQFGLAISAPPSVNKILTEALQRPLLEARRVLEVYTRQSSVRIPKAVLIGGGANMVGLPQLFNRVAGIPAVVGNPWKGLAYPKALEKRLNELGPTYAVAVGLALRGFSV